MRPPQLHGECWGGNHNENPDAFEGNDRLTIDVAVLRDASTAPAGTGTLLLHMSGIHGVEAHSHVDQSVAFTLSHH